MTCLDCDLAAKKRHHGFRSGCQGCAARSLVRSPHWRRVQAAGVQDRPYRAALAQFGLTHEQVKAAAAADKAS
jgi:hypothetical protein